MAYPSEVLNWLIDKSINEVFDKEEAYLNEFVSYVQGISGTLYEKLFSCLQKEPLEHSVLLRTEFLAKSLVPNSFVSKFYEILEKYHYRREEEFLKCMKDITVWHDLENIEFWGKVPWIKEIQISSNNKFVLKTKNEEYSFASTREQFKGEIEEIKRKRQEQNKVPLASSFPNGYNSYSFSHFDYKCAVVTHDFSIIYPKSYAIAAICPYSFQNHYWFHCYNILEDYSSVVDLSNGIVMPYEDFYRLMQPVVLNQIKGEEISNEIDKVRFSSWPLYSYTKSIPLKMFAFYHYDMLTEEQREEKYGDLIRRLNKN